MKIENCVKKNDGSATDSDLRIPTELRESCKSGFPVSVIATISSERAEQPNAKSTYSYMKTENRKHT